jgi:hypothetical protein
VDQMPILGNGTLRLLSKNRLQGKSDGLFFARIAKIYVDFLIDEIELPKQIAAFEKKPV